MTIPYYELIQKLMKSKILLALLLIAVSAGINAQPLNWQEDSPSDWSPINLMADFDNFTEGIASLNITFTETGTPYFVSDTFDVTASSAFSFSIDVLDNDPGCEVNQRVHFILNDNSTQNETSGDYTVDNGSFQTMTFTGTTPATAVKAYVIIRIYDVSANWTGSGTFNLDNSSYTENGGSNLLQNSGFENWAVPVAESTANDWWEDSPSDWTPITLEADAVNKTHGFLSAKITFTETGTPYFVSDTFDVTASSAFNFSIDVLDNDAACEVNQRIHFILNDNSGQNETSGDYSVDNASFQTMTFTGTTPGTAVKAYVIIRIYDVSANWSGSGTFNLDNASYTEDGGSNLIKNPSFEMWTAPSGAPTFESYSFEDLSPAVIGEIDVENFTIDALVPYGTDVTALVATFVTKDEATAKVGAINQVSGTTPNDFTSSVTYALTSADASTTQDWTVTVSEDAASDKKQITSFVFAGLNPEVYAEIDQLNHTITAAVPTGTDLTSLVPTISISENATVSPESGVAQDFSGDVTYTVTAQDETTQDYNVTVTETSEVILFQEFFENVPRVIPSGFTLIENDGYTPNPGDERWADSAWVVANSGRPEWAGNHMAIALSYYTDMPTDGRTDDWMITPSISLGANSMLSWKAMSLTTSGNYPDDYRVIIAPASSSITPSVNYFETYGEILLTVAPESWSAAVSNPGDGISNRSINLKDAGNGYANQDVWIAYVLITGDGGGSYIAVDDIKVVEGGSTGIFESKEQSLNVEIYPNPSSGEFRISIESKSSSVAEIEVIDLTGRSLINRNIEVNAGENIIELSASELKKGMYIIRTEINNEINVSNLIIK